ncbi:hypothetical protein [Tautonia sociabilis]|uniref:Neutral/alkaline non-lysosomal ceramidase N-terminal domain-containing protein n=1 Tax=Tautonia sociabilis TaxID=2080755 RepID=A0A432MHP9_9BACT|nr:hypothetical protein [Tautonia sociabilis]RUL86449.1 hypothetical protein TsocGM_15865 [Tautonia sociabilis]
MQPDLRLGTFDVDASPPMGHPLCGGWIKPVVGQDDPQRFRGVVLLGSDAPIVLASLDWTGVLNESHRIWTERLAEAAGTSPDRVALHCVHQHNAPFIDLVGNRLLRDAGADPLLFDERFVDDLMVRSAAAVAEAVRSASPVDLLGIGSADVEQVACNRRVIGPDGRIKYTRTSATRDPAARAEPDGTIDPTLQSISFFRNGAPVARLYYYTTHPMSYYGDGRVSADFVGLARSRRDADEAGTLHVYFTGAAGNVTAGKYNDGSPENRPVLADRVYRAMTAADASAEDHPFDHLSWATLPIHFDAREDLDLDRLRAIVADPDASVVDRNRNAMTCSWLMRLESKRPILLGRLDTNAGSILHLPAETFVEYQLYARSLAGNVPLAVAAYGDGGPWYIPLERSYREGGYEPSVSWVSTMSEPMYKSKIEELLRRS